MLTTAAVVVVLAIGDPDAGAAVDASSARAAARAKIDVEVNDLIATGQVNGCMVRKHGGYDAALFRIYGEQLPDVFAPGEKPKWPRMMASARACQAEHDAEVAARERVKESAILTARSCYAAARKSEAMKSLDAEKRASRIGGVVSNAKLYRLQSEVVVMDAVSAAAKAEAKERRLKAGKCPPPDFEAIASCIDEARAEEATEYEAAANEIAEAASACLR